MNQSQRNFLIEQIEKEINLKTKLLKDCIPESPTMQNHLLHAIMSGTIEIKSTDELKKHLKEKALKSNGNADWLGGDRCSAGKNKVYFHLRDFFIIPEEYEKLYADYKEKRDKFQTEINDLNIQLKGLIVRIKLASNKTLEGMIREVDDMGDLSLIDTKIKLLT